MKRRIGFEDQLMDFRELAGFVECAGSNGQTARAKRSLARVVVLLKSKVGNGKP
jgi:hypothetical protein